MGRTTKGRTTRSSSRGQKALQERGSAPNGRQPDEDDIRRRAYELYLERGGAPGQALDDWVRAERELRGQAT